MKNMAQRERLIYWIIALVMFGFFLHLVQAILLPFIVAIIVAYFLDPAADRLEKFGLSRENATGFITILFFLFFLLISIIIAPLLYEEIISLTLEIPKYKEIIVIDILPKITGILYSVDPHALEKIQANIGEMSGKIMEIFTKFLTDLLQSGLAILNLFSLIFITPIITFYLLRDWDKMMKKLEFLMPRSSASIIKEQLIAIDQTIAGYLRGQINVCLVLAIYYSLALTLLGLESGLFIGMATGLLTFIPYIGALTGAITGITIAYFQFGDVMGVGKIIAVFLVGQVLEGNFLTPKLVGNKVGLHPVWLIFGMLAGAAIFGFVGILIAVPVTAIIGVLVRFAISKYINSKFYLS